jgi:hypothetical protein
VPKLPTLDQFVITASWHAQIGHKPKNPCGTTYKFRALTKDSGEQIKFYRDKNKFSEVTQKLTKNLWVATKNIQATTCIMFLGILNNYSGHIYNLESYKNVSVHMKYIFGDSDFANKM